MEGEKESEEETDEGLRAFPLSQQRAFFIDGAKIFRLRFRH